MSTVSNDPLFAGSCHTAAHKIGQVAAEVMDLDAALALEPELCLNGYTHGLLQVFATRPDTEFPVLLDACQTTHGGELANECIHGVGHLLALRHPTSLKSALLECVGLRDGLSDWCIGGVMMEFGQNYLAKTWPEQYSEIDRTMGPDSPSQIAIPPEESAAPCLLIEDTRDMYQCWSEMGPFIISGLASLDDADAAAQRCTITTGTTQWACLYSVFSWLTDNADTGSDDLTTLAGIADRLCGAVATGLQSGCMNGVLYRIGLPRDVATIEPLCAQFAGELAVGCRKGLDTALQSHKNSGVA